MSGASLLVMADVVAFAGVVDAGGFSAAGRRLGLSKATVSRRVRMLEERLGARLLLRTTRSLRLTDDGARFYGRCQTILAELANAQNELMRETDGGPWRLRVRIPGLLSGLWLARLVSAFLESYPRATLSISLDGAASEATDASPDLALVHCDGADAPRDARATLPFERSVYAAPTYLARHGAPATPEDLPAHVCLLVGRHDGAGVWLLTGSENRWPVQVSGPLDGLDGATVRESLLLGLGLALMPDSVVAEDVRSGALVQLLPDYRDVSHSLYASYSPRGAAVKAIEAFLSVLADHCGAGAGAKRA